MGRNTDVMEERLLCDSTVLVTGAAGFIGSALTRRLLDRGCAVVGYDNLNSYYDVSLKEERLELSRSLGGGSFHFVKADLCDQEALERVFAEWQPQLVVNLAAQAGVRWSLDHPRDYIDSNVVGFLNVLECCRSYGVRHLVYASSSSVYGDADEVPFREDARCDKPVSLYAATKRSNELMAHTYAHLFGIPSTGLRFFTVYGPMGRPDMAYFSFANRMVSGETIRLFNEGNMLRDFTYVEDVVSGIEAVLAGDSPVGTSGAPHVVYNLGHGDPVVLGEFVRTLEESLRRYGVLSREVSYELVPMQPGDVHRTYADTSAFAARYGYRPLTTLAEGLDNFASWYAQWRARG